MENMDIKSKKIDVLKLEVEEATGDYLTVLTQVTSQIGLLRDKCNSKVNKIEYYKHKSCLRISTPHVHVSRSMRGEQIPTVLVLKSTAETILQHVQVDSDKFCETVNTTSTPNYINVSTY